MGDPKFEVELHHGGQFLKERFGNQYLGGRTKEGLEFDLDHWSLQEITAILKELGYKGYMKIWYVEPEKTLNTGLKELKSDSDCMSMANLVLSTIMKQIEIYEVDGYNESNGIEVTSNDPDFVPSENDIECDNNSSNDEFDVEGRLDDSADDGEHEDYFEAAENIVNEVESIPNVQVIDKAPTIEVEGEISDGYESETVYSIDGSEDDEQSKHKHEMFNPAEMCMDYNWKVGTEFTSLKQFKDAMKEWALLNGKDIRYVKNDKLRCRVKCNGEFCDWMAFVSKVGNEETYELKRLNGIHNCGKTFKGHLASSNWVADRLSGTMRLGEKKSLGNVIQDVKDNYMAEISVNKAYWARRKAIERLEGQAIEQYAIIWDYCEEVRNKNVGSTIKVMVDRPTLVQERRFKRLYMCIDAVKTGFLAACRPIIGVDGCHLKGLYGQQLLVAVGRDPNDNYFPIAVAAVEAETKDSWGWFLTLLLQDIGSQGENRFVWISDQQKGLVQVFEEPMPGVDHRFCLRHLYANCKKQFGGGSALKDFIMSIAKATYVQDWEKKMKQLEKLKKECHDKMSQLDPRLWACSHFSFYPKSDMLMNNISEAFSGRILDARDKPILTMLEYIRCYWMTIFTEKRVNGERYRGKILPKPKKRLDTKVINSRHWKCKMAGEWSFEVEHTYRHISEKFTVDLERGSCSCRLSELTGLPCRHACGCIFFKGGNPEDYISAYYTPAAYLACYSPVVNPINGQNLWPTLNFDKILPPIHRPKPGRPRKLRRREHDENPNSSRSSRVGTIIWCTRCMQVGHNKTTCKQPPHVTESASDAAIGEAPVVGESESNVVQPTYVESDVVQPTAAVGSNVAAPTEVTVKTGPDVAGSDGSVRGRGRGRGRPRGRGRARDSSIEAQSQSTANFNSALKRPKLPTIKPKWK